MDGWKIIFQTPLPVYAVLAVGAVLLVSAVAFALRDSRRLSRRVRTVILCLRITAIILFVIIALAPKFVMKQPDPQMPVCFILVDGSESMTFEDNYTGEEAKALEAMLNPSNPGNSETTPPAVKRSASKLNRQEILQHIIEKTQLLTEIKKKFDITGAVFASGIRPVSFSEGLPDELVGEDGYSTNLGKALEKVASGWQTSRPAAVIIFSDGAWNRGPDPVGPARALGRRSIPVYTVALGNPNPAKDIAVTAVRVPRQVFLGQQVSMEVDVRGTGFGPRRVAVEVLMNGEIIATKYVYLAPSGQTVTTSVMLVPDKPDIYTYSVRVPVVEGESRDDNNLAYATVEVTEKKIRVLLVESVPRWEFRFFKNVLERDPSVDLKVFLARPGVGPARGGRYIEKLPEDKRELAKYDLIIIGDIGNKYLTPRFEQEVANMVTKLGTGLVVLAGRGGNYRSLAGTPLSRILPVILLEGAADTRSGNITADYRMELTADGRRHLMMRLDSEARSSSAIWGSLPKFRWCANIAGLQPGAIALAVHPYWTVGSEKLPILALGRAGAGKVLFVGTEETWRWRKAVGDRHHYRFWAQLVRWMTQRRFQRDTGPVRLSAQPAQCRIGSPVAVEAYCLDKDGFPLESTTVHLVVRDDEGETQRIQMKAMPGGWGLYETTWTPTGAGDFKLLTFVDYYGAKPMGSPVEIQVTAPDVEKNFPAANHTALDAMAEASGGRMLKAWETDELPGLLLARSKERMLTSEFSPSENFAAFLIPMALLAVEWAITKRSAVA
ncbi:MAG: hypothetical protein QGD94_03890 [Planctomycetia bacterium]|nr:hypothetical protein [Planctomycetia bacterium]